jgi:hypothetical protein
VQISVPATPAHDSALDHWPPKWDAAIGQNPSTEFRR